MKAISRDQVTVCLPKWSDKLDVEDREWVRHWDVLREVLLMTILNTAYDMLQLTDGTVNTWTTTNIPRGSLRGIPIPIYVHKITS